MSDGLKNVSSSGGAFIKFDGKQYTLQKVFLGGLSEIEAYLKSMRENPLARLAEHLDKFASAHHEKLIAVAIRESTELNRPVSMDDVQEFTNTIEGQQFFFWLSVRQNHPELSELKAVRELLRLQNLAKLKELSGKLLEVSGLGPLANAAKNSPAPDLPAPKDLHESRGLESIST